MRVLFLSTSMGMGGADSQLLAAAQEMRARGHQVLIVSMTALGPMGLRARKLGIPVESLEMRRGMPDPRALVRLSRMVREWRPDIVHSHMVHANLMARALRLVAPVPALVSTIHNIYEGGALLMAAYRLTNGLTDHMTIISEAAAERFIRDRIVPPELLRVVPNGVDPELYGRVAPGVREELREALGLGNRFVWLAVGRFEVAKDYPNMLRAFAIVQKRHPDAVLLLVGRGSLQPETEALARELELTTAVRGQPRGGVGWRDWVSGAPAGPRSPGRGYAAAGGAGPRRAAQTGREGTGTCPDPPRPDPCGGTVGGVISGGPGP
ncbi:MAG: hypothetical protein K0S19_1655 [Geminicoccaceae bacterium]|nr:hypothetical protein [Geminicoccaceae bacterium]